MKVSNKGFTLIEVIIYIALFSIIIGGGMIAVYEVIQSTDAGANHVIMEEEANFLLRKINWALTGATNAVPSGGGTILTVTKGTTLVFLFDPASKSLKLNSTVLNSSSISVTSVAFTSPATNAITADFTLKTSQNGRNVTESFTTTKYLRQ